MNTTFPFGRIMYAVATLSFGFELLITRNFPVALLPIPASFPGRPALAVVLGIVLAVAGLSILALRKADIASWIVGILWLLTAFTLHAPALVSNPYNANEWTVFFELMALSGGAFYLAGELGRQLDRRPSPRFNWILIGRFLFAISLIIFGVLHFMYAAFIATLIPTWIPARLFWAYFVGVAFVATAVSLSIRRQEALAANLLGLMFLLWVIGLHAPLVIANPQSEPEWTSLFVALAMSGISFTMVRLANQKELSWV